MRAFCLLRNRGLLLAGMPQRCGEHGDSGGMTPAYPGANHGPFEVPEAGPLDGPVVESMEGPPRSRRLADRTHGGDTRGMLCRPGSDRLSDGPQKFQSEWQRGKNPSRHPLSIPYGRPPISRP